MTRVLELQWKSEKQLDLKSILRASTPIGNKANLNINPMLQVKNWTDKVFDLFRNYRGKTVAHFTWPINKKLWKLWHAFGSNKRPHKGYTYDFTLKPTCLECPSLKIGNTPRRFLKYWNVTGFEGMSSTDDNSNSICHSSLNGIKGTWLRCPTE